MSNSDSDLEPELLGDIARLQEEIDEDDQNYEKEIELYDKAIIANQKAIDKIQNVLVTLQKMLVKKEEALALNKKMTVRTMNPTNILELIRPRLFGYPFFRDKKERTPPPNEDTILQRQLRMVNFLDIAPKNSWLHHDKEKLLKHILAMSRQVKVDVLQNKLSHLCAKNKETHERAIAENYIKRQIKEVEKLPLSAVYLSSDEEYDWDAIAYLMDHRYKPNELQAMWNLQLHPSLRQGKLSRVEHILLQNIAQQHNHQDWTQIASDLGGRRSPYQCFLMYRTVIADNNKGVKWTPEEDEYLRQTIEFYRSGNNIPWGTVSSCFENKTKSQVYARYSRSVKPEIRKGKFLPEEDAVILAAFDHFGNDFRKIAQYLPGRAQNQVRQRYNMSLSKTTSNIWTVEEDQKLLHFVKSMQVDNINYADVAKHFENKDRIALRIRHLTLMRWIRSNPHKDVRSAPRRGARSLPSLKVERLDLRTAVERLVTRLENESSDSVDNKSINFNELIMATIVKKIKNKQIFNEKDLVINTHSTLTCDAQTIKYNTNCMRTLLLALKANLDPELFVISPLSTKYGMLTNRAVNETVPASTVKTYSRKRKVEAAPIIGTNVTVWNDTPVFRTKYCLPPNYQTLCGCKTLLQEAYKKNLKFRKNLYLLKCSILKFHYTKFVERLEILLTWPLIMSNAPAPNIKGLHDTNIDKDAGTDSSKTPSSTSEMGPSTSRMKF